MTGEDCSQPPEGVAATMLPSASMTSMWTVSPRRLAAVMEASVGSPTVAPPAFTVPGMRTLASARATCSA